MSLTVAKFLEPCGADAEELRHILADSVRSTSVDGRYEVLGKTQPWRSFYSHDTHSVPFLRDALETEFIPRWQAWISDVARVIHSERMLENLYSNTLMTRVNIALHHAIPQKGQCITIITCPGAFDSHDPDVKGGKNTVILPDWIALEGEYKPHDDSFPSLEEIALCGKVVAVGDTKLVSRRLATSGVEGKGGKDTIAGTHSCHPSYLAQVQHYAKMLRTRFGFVLTNKELVLAQFLREEDPAPRLHGERGLRSLTGRILHPGLSSDLQSLGAEERDEKAVHRLSSAYLSHPKRRYNSSDDSTPSRRSPPFDTLEDEYINGLPSTPSAPPRVVEDLPSSPPGPSQAVERPTPRGLVLTPNREILQSSSPRHVTNSSIRRASELVGSPYGLISSEPIFPQSSGTPYLSSERDYDIGKVLIKSFRIPNTCDRDEIQIAEGLQPAKALFVMLMHASSVGALGRRIGKDEVPFGSQ
ncbi:hypothetical protein N7523_005693 [Penicillium sp. IBT 18751x]|nr:hypothetical protein N7523_005693 [Penicillium sp. IBT 18751x]